MSGGSSLVLEVAWSRALSLSLGNSHQAVATVVASMMAGLCLGSLATARALHRLPRLARAYAAVEMGIGAYAALTPLLFRSLPFLLAPLYALPPSAFAFLRFLLVFLILLPPAAGMGATLPLLTAALTREGESVGGRLYGLNTLGAFLGTLAGGFLLLPGLGLFRTTLLAGATSFAVGALAWHFTGSATRPTGERPRREEPSVAPLATGWILPLYAASGALAMVYEITWTRVLGPLAGTSVYSFTLILAAILAGIGVGSLVLSLVPPDRFDPGRGFVVGQMVLSGAAFLSLWALRGVPDLMIEVAASTRSRVGAFFVWEFALFCSIVLLPGLVLGALFPLAARLLGRLEREAGAEVGRVYAWNTAGSIAGALLAGFLLVERFGSEKTLVGASVGSAVLGLAALPLAAGRWFRPAATTAGAALTLTFPFLLPPWDPYRMTGGISQLLRDLRAQGPGISAANALGIARTPDTRVVFHREGKTSTVTVTQEWLDRWLRVDGKTDASTTDGDMLTQTLLGQLPFFFAHRTGDACVIGFGSGVTSHAVLTHSVRRLDNIEIEAQVIAASRFFEQVNDRPLADPRSRLLVEDARTALLYRPQRYDVVISEPSNPWMAGVNNLFTREFYALVRSRLNPGGIFCQWVQSYEMSAESLQAMLDTIAGSFPHTHFFSLNRGSDLILLASDRPLALAPGASELFPDRPDVAADLGRIRIRSLSDLAILYTAAMPAPAPGALFNTDDNSLMQYRGPLEMLQPQEYQDPSKVTSTPALLQLFYPGRAETEALADLARAALRREEVALAERFTLLRGERSPDPETAMIQRELDALRRRLALRARVEALLQEAEDGFKARDPAGSLARLEQAEDLGLDGAEQISRAGYLWLNLGRHARAEKRLDEVILLAEPSSHYLYQALAGRGAARFRTNRRAEGMADLAAAKALDPDQPLAYLLLGLALSQVGDRAGALREFRAGLAKTPTDERLRRALTLTSSPGR